jgi:hypothetical protein
MKLCIDCKWHEIGGVGWVVEYPHLCIHKGRCISPVTGESSILATRCIDERTEEGSCGPDGKLWEAK